MTETTMEKNPTTTTAAQHWATEIGRRVAARRAARQAEAAAEVEATGQRAAVPVAVLAQRFADVAVRVVEAVDAFGTAAGVGIFSEPPAPGSIQLRSDDDRLTLLRQDEDLRVTVRSRSRGDEFTIALDDGDFDAEVAARQIVRVFIQQLSLSHGGSYVDPR
ncbi:MAG: hypothetical protein WEG40_06370 [Candidatus Rokuibacteriota bacterium]